MSFIRAFFWCHFVGMEKIHTIHEGDSIGSFWKAEIAHKDDFLNFSDTEILFRDNKGWKEIDITDESGIISFSELENENGNIIKYQGSFGLHDPILEISKKMKAFIGRKSVVRLTSHNNEVYVLGDPFNPVFISSDGSTGRKYTDRSQIDYSFSVDMPFYC